MAIAKNKPLTTRKGSKKTASPSAKGSTVKADGEKPEVLTPLGDSGLGTQGTQRDLSRSG